MMVYFIQNFYAFAAVIKGILFSNLIQSCFGYKRRTCKITQSCSIINCVKDGFTHRNIRPYLPLGLANKGNRDQISTLQQVFGNLRSDLLNAACRRSNSSLKMKTKCFHRILNDIFFIVCCRKAPLNVRKPNPKSTVRVFINNCKIIHSISFHIQPAVFAIWRATPKDRSFFGCGTVRRLLPFINWWCDPTILRSSQPSFFNFLSIFWLLRSIYKYIPENTFCVNNYAQIYTQKHWVDM